MITLSGWTIKPPSAVSRFVFFVLLSGVMMLLDHRGQQLETIRRSLNVIAYPVQLVAAMPVRIGNAVWEFFRGKTSLQENYLRLQEENRALLLRLQKYDTLAAENDHLRGLLGAAARAHERATVAELLEVSPEPFTRKIILTKGARDEVYVGQPVIDAYGIMGQITEVGAMTSQVTLITDPSHAIPTQVVRNGLRTIVFGTGAHDYVEVPYLTAAADIKEGDELVSSGIGGVFPAGYPVARVVRVINNPNESFLKIIARPMARLDHNKEVMLLWSTRPANKPLRSDIKPSAAPAKARK